MSLDRTVGTAALRARVHAIETPNRATDEERLPFGVGAMDDKLVGGGLAIAALHELSPASTNLNDDAAAVLFAAGIACRAAENGTVLWALARRDLFAPALAQAGLSPDRLIYAECRRDEDVLAVVEEGLRDASLSAVVGEIGRVTMTSTRRLQLSTEESGTVALVLKRWRRSGDDPLGAPSAATTRWRIGCVPSQQLSTSGIARPRWRIELARQRGGPAHQWIMEGTDEAGRLALPAEPAYRPPSADRRQVRHAA